MQRAVGFGFGGDVDLDLEFGGFFFEDHSKANVVRHNGRFVTQPTVTFED
jgi:hypothetical protein